MIQPHVSICYRPGEFVLPARYIGKVPAGRLASTPGDNVAEAAGRLCYDSLTSVAGRPTPEYHAHIRETRHHSVYGHVVETFEALVVSPTHGFQLLTALIGRPGVWITLVNRDTIRFAISLRAVIEWDNHGVGGELSQKTGETIRDMLSHKYPFTLAGCGGQDVTLEARHIRPVTPELPQEKWVSLYIEGVSRDFLQEWVRHHYQANPSVRSTRYCDEGGSHQIIHPAIQGTALENLAAHHTDNARRAYRLVYTQLIGDGVDRKTARGAARSLLPGATETRMVFSLSEFQAKHILHLRADHGTGTVDPEVSRLAEMMRPVLQAEGWKV